jgi:hemolysin type calcium-binding protein
MKTAVVLVASLCLAAPGVASAATASLDREPSDLGPGITVENLHYRAAPGEANRLRVSLNNSSGVYTLTDPVGITPGANCSRPRRTDITRVRCALSRGIRVGGVLIRLGDRNDRARVSGRGAVVLGGPGTDALTGSGLRDTLSAGDSDTKPTRARTRDRLSGNGGDDLLLGSGGNNRITGGGGQDSISAGRGNDLIKARDRQVDQVRCGGGFDRATLDTADFLADRCRAVSRPAVPAATPIELFTSGVRAYLTVGCPRDARLRRCKGTVVLSRGSRTFGTRRFDIARGHKLTPAGFRLPRDILRRIGPNGGPRLLVVVRSRSAARLTTTFLVRMAIPPQGD